MSDMLLSNLQRCALSQFLTAGCSPAKVRSLHQLHLQSRLQCISLCLCTLLLLPLLLHTAPRNGCVGALDTTYVAVASCRGQLAESDLPYKPVDSNACPPNPKRDSMKAALNFKWAQVPRTNIDLARAVTTAPTLISVKADGSAWQLYRSGIVGCSVEAKSDATNRELLGTCLLHSGCIS
jgi:hypothetical protein